MIAIIRVYVNDVDADIDVIANIGLDATGHLIVRSITNCTDYTWIQINLQKLMSDGINIQSKIKENHRPYKPEVKTPLVGNKSDEPMYNKIPEDVEIDRRTLLVSSELVNNVDTSSKLDNEKFNNYADSTLKKIMNNFYDRYNQRDDIVKYIQNSLKYIEESINGGIIEMGKLRDDVNSMKESIFEIEDYITNYCDDFEDEETEESNTKTDFDDSTEEYSHIDDEKPQCTKVMTFENSATLMNIGGVYYLHNFYEDTTLMSVDKKHWAVCIENDIPEQYKDFINQKYLIDIRTFVGGFSYWVTMMDPINRETNLPVHISITNKLLEEIFKVTYNLTTEALGNRYFSMSKPELINYIHTIIFDNPKTKNYFKVLNTSYNNAQKIRNGENPDSPKVAFCSRYSGPHWKDGFINLDTLACNVKNSILQFSRYTAE